MADVTLVTHFVIADPKAEYPLHGVFGGVTPQGEIAASFYSERAAIPKEMDMVIAVSENGMGGVGTEGERRGKTGAIRTVTSTYYMTADMAENIGKWLLEKAAERRAVNGNS